MLPTWQPRSKQAPKPSYKTFFVSCIMYKATEFHRGHVIPAPEQWTNSAKPRATRMGPPYLAAFTVPNTICTWRHSRFPSVPRRRETKDIVLVCISGFLDTIPLFYGALQDSWAGEVASSRSAPDLNSIQTLPTQIGRDILGKFRDTSLPLDYSLRPNSSVVWGFKTGYRRKGISSSEECKSGERHQAFLWFSCLYHLIVFENFISYCTVYFLMYYSNQEM